VAAVLLYLRYKRNRLGLTVFGGLPRVSPWSGAAQLVLGAGTIIWTLKAF